MKRQDLNLASRPFVNQRPVGRLAWLLWILGAMLLVANFNAYRGYFSGSDDKVAEIQSLDDKIVNHETTIRELKSSLLTMDLVQLNEQVDFLNRKISERTFSWSHLFDQLEEVLPDDVRISSLTPKVTEFSQRRRAADADPLLGDRVVMSIVAVAKTVDAQLDMVDGFFQHPSFESPKLSSDAQTGGGSRFNLSVIYLPVRPEAQLIAEGPEATSSSPGDPQNRGAIQGAVLADTAKGNPPGPSSRRRAGQRNKGSARPNESATSPGRQPTVASSANPKTPDSIPDPLSDTAENRRGTRSGTAPRGGTFGAPGAASGATDRRTTSAAGAPNRPRTSGGTGTTRQRGGSTGAPASDDGSTAAPTAPADDGLRPAGRVPSASSALEPQ